MKHHIYIFYFIVCLLIAPYSYSAVTSHGEINVVGETVGIVPASSTVPLVVTLSVDRSLAVPGEEIKTIEITMPKGFVTQVSDFKSVTRDGEKLLAKVVVSGGNVLRVELTEVIDDFQNSIFNITFDSRTPNTIFLAEFSVRLRNPDDVPVGEYIRPGQADSKLNNDDLDLQIIPNVPPAPVTDFTAEADKNGENDVTLRWKNSTDPDVNGYLIYRDNDFQITVENRASTTYRDINVTPGEHKYEITAYKTILLQSGRSPIQTVVVSVDTAAPKPPTGLRIDRIDEGIKVSWNPSESRDTSKYHILFGSAETTTLEQLIDGEIPVNRSTNSTTEYEYIDRRPLSIGSYTYAVVAIDEANNTSAPVKKRYRIFNKPYPNPFTPLSSDPDFNMVIFPIQTIDDSDGEFSVLLYNLNGVLVKTLTAQLGDSELRWDGKNDNGDIVESGIYLYQLQVGESYKTGTIIVAK